MKQKFGLEIKEEAKGDIENAHGWYEEQLTNLGESFIKYVDKAFRDIRKTPEEYNNHICRISH